jgi:hypothetical protein
MGTNDLTRIPGGPQDKGVNTFEPDIGPEITWDESTVNVSAGVRRGVSVRPGMAPLPGHADTETLASTNCNGLMKSESASGNGLQNRELIFGIVPITLTAFTGGYPKANSQYLVYLVGLDDSSNVCLDACVGALFDTPFYEQVANLSAGLAASSYREESPLVRRHKTELLNLPQAATPTAADMKATLRHVASRYWMPYAQVSVSGKRIPYQWMLAKTTSTPDATTAPNMNIWQVTFTSGDAKQISGGAPSELITREFKDNDRRVLSVYCLNTNGYTIDIQYTVPITSEANTSGPTVYLTNDMYLSLTGASKTGASTSYGSVVGALINDSGSFTNSRHDAILFAGEKPLAVIYQDWLLSAKGIMPRWVDLSNPGAGVPRPGAGITSLDGADQKPSGFYISLVETTTNAGNGILQAATQYDIGFSFYDKLIDYESNVAFAQTIQTGGTFGSTAVYAAIVVNTSSTTINLYQFMIDALYQTMAVPWEFTEALPVTYSGRPTQPVPRGASINDYEYRFYYRESGTNEWLPAGSFDAAQYWFFANWPGGVGPLICAGPVGGLPGGQPNGFIDYSSLPKQRYICTLSYKNRAFWWSEKTMQFSLYNNIYAYPLRNTVPASTGVWRGGIVHIQLGETIQTSRLVVFGSDAAFCGRFTGYPKKQTVRISADSTGQFDLDGSDFELDYLCDATAYGYRAAVVAEGILYWWGPQGVYMDNGNDKPQKISEVLEPDIFRYVDTGRIDEIHAVYCKNTKEVTWFYPPKTADSSFPTHGLVMNVRSGNFYPAKFRCQVDSSQILKLERDLTDDHIDGERVILHCRATAAATISRSFFYDQLCKSGEQGPTRELMVKTVATPTSGRRRFTIAGGSVSISTVAVGDLIAVQNAKGYATSMTSADDMIALVTANGTTYLDVLLPSGATWDASATLTQGLAFPIYHLPAGGASAGLHGIYYLIATNYWLPGESGLADSWHWLYVHFLFKYDEWPAKDGTAMTFSYRTPTSPAFVSDTISLEDNSDGHCQRHHGMRLGESGAIEGQALKWKLSGYHIGHEWTLEYLEAHCTPEDGNILKQFQQQG